MDSTIGFGPVNRGSNPRGLITIIFINIHFIFLTMDKNNYELSSFLEARERWMWSEKALAALESQKTEEPEPRCYRNGRSCDICDDYYTCPVLKK